MTPITSAMIEVTLCRRIKLLIWKKKFSTAPMVDLGRSLGGFEITFGIVSRIEVRDGTMKAPDSVVSQ